MTAQPNSFDFMPIEQAGVPILVRPKVMERYWGYDVAKNEMEIDLAVLVRGVACVMMVGAFSAAFAIWLVPSAVISGEAMFGKLWMSVMFIVLAGALFQFSARSTRVRVQIDTANGELREVVAGPFGTDVVLAHYGFDAVKAVTVEASKLDPNLGQLQITLKSGAIVPAGDGTVLALRHLRDRVATDCGLERSSPPRAFTWAGPPEI